MVLTRPLLVLLVLVPGAALAQRETTRDALGRLEASLSTRVTEVGALARKDLLPTIIVSAEPRFEETRAWYPTQAAGTLIRIFGGSGVRLCEACMSARLRVEGGRVEQSTVALDAPEIVRFDETVRGSSEPARTAIWIDETTRGVSLRIIDLRNSRVVLAENFDDSPTTAASLARTSSLLREEQRRARGEALTHTFFDIGVLPMQHISLDFSEQWGDTNANLAGFTFSVFDPLVGVGGSYFRIIPEAFNLTIGAKVLVSVPNAVIRAVAPDGTNTAAFLDPLFSAVLVVRWPIFKTNFGLVATVSTNGRVSLGISLLNISLLPVLP